jgi:hypothetical protein
MWRIHKKGRCFQNGNSISPNRRCNIIDEIKFKRGNKDTGIFNGNFVDVASKFEVSNATAQNYGGNTARLRTFNRSMEGEIDEVCPMVLFSLLNF